MPRKMLRSESASCIYPDAMLNPRQKLLRRATIFSLLLCAATANARAQSPSGETVDPQASFQRYSQDAAAARDAGRFVDARRDYLEALKIQPKWQEGWWNLGTLLYDHDQYADAISAFQQLTEFAPQASPGWIFLGLCEFEAGDYPDALEHLAKGEALGGVDDAEIARVAKYHLALLRIRSGDFERASTALTGLTTAGQTSPQVNFALGLAFLRVPLLPNQIDPSKEALVQSAGVIAGLIAANNTAAASEASRLIIAKYPDAPYLPQAFAEALAHDGKVEDARSEPQRALQALPQAMKERIVKWYEANASADYAHPETAAGVDAIFATAMRDYSTNNFSEAIAALKPWLQTNPKSGTGWAVLGLSEFAVHDYDNALIHLQRGEQLGLNGSPESVGLAKYRLGLLLNREGQFATAEQVLMSATVSEPLASKVRFALGMALLRLTGFPEEVPGSQRTLVEAAGEIAALLRDSKYDAAFPRCDELLKKYPSSPFLHYTYGTALASLSQFDEAAKQFRAELALSPESELPYLGLASLELRRRRAADALEPARHAVQLAPHSATAHYLLGRSYLETGRPDEAIAELQEASAITPGSPEVHFILAKAYAKANQPVKAEEERAIFAQLNALAERRRGQQGSQAYSAHDAAEAGISSVAHPE